MTFSNDGVEIVRALFFDKSPGYNWAVASRQDRHAVHSSPKSQATVHR